MAAPTAEVISLVRLYGPLALLLFTFLETSMIFPLLPSEVVVPAAAALLVADMPSFFVFVTTATIGGTLGAVVPYYVFRETRLGRAVWLGRYVRVSDDRLKSVQAWFRRWGRSSVLWGRLLPVLRSAVSIPAGFANMDPRWFVAYTAIGTSTFYAASGAIVYYARQQSLFETAVSVLARWPALVAGGFAVVLVVVSAGWWFSLKKR